MDSADYNPSWLLSLFRQQKVIRAVAFLYVCVRPLQSRGNHASCFGLRSHYPNICLKILPREATSHCSKLLTARRPAEHLSDPLQFH